MGIYFNAVNNTRKQYVHLGKMSVPECARLQRLFKSEQWSLGDDIRIWPDYAQEPDDWGPPWEDVTDWGSD